MGFLVGLCVPSTSMERIVQRILPYSKGTSFFTKNTESLSIDHLHRYLRKPHDGIYFHSGGTDNNGGHHDWKNKMGWGLGTYHYHHGLGPHFHNPTCPYGVETKASLITLLKKNSFNVYTTEIAMDNSLKYIFEASIELAPMTVYFKLQFGALNMSQEGFYLITPSTNQLVEKFWGTDLKPEMKMVDTALGKGRRDVLI